MDLNYVRSPKYFEATARWGRELSLLGGVFLDEVGDFLGVGIPTFFGVVTKVGDFDFPTAEAEGDFVDGDFALTRHAAAATALLFVL